MPCNAATWHIGLAHALPRAQDGKSIITGWGDGKIRAFGPESGRQLWTIHDAHHGAVAALAGTYDSARIISGGLSDNDVRVWDARSQSLLASMTEHQVQLRNIAGTLACLLCISGSIAHQKV